MTLRAILVWYVSVAHIEQVLDGIEIPFGRSPIACAKRLCKFCFEAFFWCAVLQRHVARKELRRVIIT